MRVPWMCQYRPSCRTPPRPELLHHLQGLGKLRHPFLAGDGPQRDFFEVIGQADTQIQPPSTNVIERDHI